ncbi:hypothetical protein JIR001_28620 [Polycladomyces abyssicola]|uniref:Uncharacterized protein n=1 Tax=Polycladomyces abyssicola TaxID=1125966 RepID=A0A8D5UIZ6_9BACL|nr:hypothetical protein JIR001_28620 [Polycladomyces abyssicola]
MLGEFRLDTGRDVKHFSAILPASQPRRLELGDPRDLPFCTGLMFPMQERADQSLYLTHTDFTRRTGTDFFLGIWFLGESLHRSYLFQSAMTRYA